MIRSMAKGAMYIIAQMNTMMEIGGKERDMERERQGMHMEMFMLVTSKRMRGMDLG